MLFYVYLFALVLGGVLLAASIFSGGDGDADVDADADADVDAEAEADAEGGTPQGSLAGVFTTVLSLRFWTFFAAFFGLTGLVLDGADLVPGTAAPLVTAVLTGLVAGFVTVRVFRSLHRSESGAVVSAADYVGKTGRVLLGFSADELGKVRLEIGGTTVDLLAKTDEVVRFEPGDEALIVSLQDHTAFVARLERAGREMTPSDKDIG